MNVLMIVGLAANVIECACQPPEESNFNGGLTPLQAAMNVPAPLTTCADDHLSDANGAPGTVGLTAAPFAVTFLIWPPTAANRNSCPGAAYSSRLSTRPPIAGVQMSWPFLVETPSGCGMRLSSRR